MSRCACACACVRMCMFYEHKYLVTNLLKFAIEFDICVVYIFKALCEKLYKRNMKNGMDFM